MEDKIEHYKREIEGYKKSSMILVGAIFLALLLGIMLGRWLENAPPDYCGFNPKESVCSEPEDIQY